MHIFEGAYVAVSINVDGFLGVRTWKTNLATTEL